MKHNDNSGVLTAQRSRRPRRQIAIQSIAPSVRLSISEECAPPLLSASHALFAQREGAKLQGRGETLYYKRYAKPIKIENNICVKETIKKWLN